MTGHQPLTTDVNAVIDAHQRSCYRLAVEGVDTFVLDSGHGQPVVCLPGVLASSFLYRKLIGELAARGPRGIAFDLPGLGLADRLAAFDYTWTDLGRFASGQLKPSSWIGSIWWCTISEGRWVRARGRASGPGCLAHVSTRRSRSTLSSPVGDEAVRGERSGRGYLRLLNPPIFRWLMRHQGVADLSKITTAELDAYLVLLRRTDNDRGFLKIMRGFGADPGQA